jgi:hypothetical protein
VGRLSRSSTLTALVRAPARLTASAAVPVLVFFGVATVIGLLLRGIVGLRRRAAARRPDVSDGELCELEQASRISSAALLAAVGGLVVVGLAVLAR